MGANVIMGQVKVGTLYNTSKAKIMVVVYASTLWNSLSGVTLKQLKEITGLSSSYLNARLPIFSGRRRYPLTNKTWDRVLLKRKAVELNNVPVFLYWLSPYGKKWVEDMLPREIFWEIVTKLGLKKAD